MNYKNQEKQWLLDEKYQGIESLDFFDDLEKLKSGTPLAYLIGNIPFLSCIIDLEYKSLIPRTETEYWVNYVLEKYVPENTSGNILDIFSGSGCIGTALAKQRPNSYVDFAEIKKENIKQIKKNLKLNKIPEVNFSIYQSDVFSSLPEKKYNFIFANPPYISKERLDTVQDSVLHHEDPTALFAENEGLYFIEKLIKESGGFLNPNGIVFIEYDSWQTEKIKDLLKQYNIKNYSIIQDQYQKDRVLMFKK